MVGIRRALALLLLSFYFWQFLITALLGPEELLPAFIGLTICYGLAFVGIAAEWFWARWFAIGIGHFGSLFLISLLQVGFEPTIAVLGLSHVAVALFLAGEVWRPATSAPRRRPSAGTSKRSRWCRCAAR
jgi:hypothetical protein